MKFVKQDKPKQLEIQFAERLIASPIAGAYPTYFLEFDDRIVVEYWGDKGVDLGERNVFAFDRGGNVLWQIERYLTTPPSDNYRQPFTSLRYDAENEIAYINTWGGGQAKLDLSSGKLDRIDLKRHY